MKKQLLTMVFILCAVCAEAQVIWNVRAGAGVSRITDITFAWKGGFGAEIPISEKFLFVPSFECAKKVVTDERYSSSSYSIGTSEPIYMQIPLQVGYKLMSRSLYEINLKLGPYFAYAIEDSPEEDFDYGIDAGIDFEYRHLVIGLDFQAGFTSVGDYKDHYTTAAFLTFGDAPEGRHLCLYEQHLLLPQDREVAEA